MRAAVVEIATNTVLNVIVADANIDAAPEGSFLVNLSDDTGCNPGWAYDPLTQTFYDPTLATGA